MFRDESTAPPRWVWPEVQRWLAPSRHPTLSRDEVHLWCICLDGAEESLSDPAVLSQAERARAGRFHRIADGRRFMQSHVALRKILAAYLGVAPWALRFATSEAGKPALLHQDGDEEIAFNLSHTDDLAMLAIAANREVGVDIERIRAIPESMQIAAEILSDCELRDFMRIPRARRDASLFRAWTRKEAYVKALGCGLSLPLRTVDLGLLERPRAQQCLIRDHESGRRAWLLHTMTPTRQHAAAVVAEGGGQRIVYRHFAFQSGGT